MSKTSLCRLLIWAGLLATALPCSADGTTLDFDAKAKKFAGPHEVAYGASVTVRVFRANTFTHTYSLRGVATDLHASSVPGPLENIVLKTAVPGVADPAPAVESPAVRMAAPTLPTSFNEAVEAWGKAWADLEALTRKELKLGDKLNLDRRLDAIAYDDTLDNKEVVEKMAKETREFLGGGGEPSDVIDEKLGLPVKTRSNGLDQYDRLLRDAHLRVSSEHLAILAAGDPVAVRLSTAIMSQIERYQKRVEEDLEAARLLVSKAQDKIERAHEYLEAADSAARLDGFSLGPVEATGDEYALFVVATPTKKFLEHKDGEGVLAAPDKVETRHTLSVYGRQVLDFSLGAIYTNLKGSHFYKDSGGVVHRGADDGSDIQTAALAHWYRTPRPNALAPALSLGVSLDADRPRLLLGGSLVYGTSTRVVLTLGAAMGRVDRLNGMRVGQNVGDRDLDTASVQRTSFFAGLSLNFFTR